VRPDNIKTTGASGNAQGLCPLDSEAGVDPPQFYDFGLVAPHATRTAGDVPTDINSYGAFQPGSAASR
jgi:hypothetical protein